MNVCMYVMYVMYVILYVKATTYTHGLCSGNFHTVRTLLIALTKLVPIDWFPS
jgi:hypothetical protein